jgi:hypothetical protein
MILIPEGVKLNFFFSLSRHNEHLTFNAKRSPSKRDLDVNLLACIIRRGA